MKIKELSEIKHEEYVVSEEKLQNEYDFFIATQVITEMLKRDLITREEHKKLHLLNLKSFNQI